MPYSCNIIQIDFKNEKISKKNLTCMHYSKTLTLAMQGLLSLAHLKTSSVFTRQCVNYLDIAVHHNIKLELACT